jgi:hypothetical protein
MVSAWASAHPVGVLKLKKMATVAAKERPLRRSNDMEISAM